MTAVAPKKLTAADLCAAVQARYTRPEWLVEEEVTLAGRRLDLVAFNLWAARGYRVLGFEVKVDRGDWMRELGNVRKAEEWQRVVDDFYLVTPPKLVRPDELPEGWGHLELVGSRMMTRRYPAKQEPRSTLPREIIARVIGRASQRLERMEFDVQSRLRDHLRREAEERARGALVTERESERSELKEMRERYAEVLAAMGIGPREWDRHKQALRAAGILARYEMDRERLRESVRRVEEDLGRHHRSVAEAAAELDKNEGIS